MKGWEGIPIQEVVGSFQLLHSALIHIFIPHPARQIYSLSVCLSCLSEHVLAPVNSSTQNLMQGGIPFASVSAFLFCLWSFYLPHYSELSIGDRISLNVITPACLSSRCLSACLSEITRPHFPSGKVRFRSISLSSRTFVRPICLKFCLICLSVFDSCTSLNVSLCRRKVRFERISCLWARVLYISSGHCPLCPSDCLSCLSVCLSFLPVSQCLSL